MRYPPLYQIYLDMAYRHLHQSLRKHVLGLSKYGMGSLPMQAGLLEVFISRFSPDCPPVTVVSLDRRIEQAVPDFVPFTDCTGAVSSLRTVRFSYLAI